MSTVDDAANGVLDEKRARLARLLTAKTQASGAAPLSSMQERLWFLAQLSPQNTAYNLAIPLRLLGPLHEAALARALQEIVRRHDVLRASFPAVDGVPRQVIAPVFDLPLPLVDLCHLPTEARAEQVQAILEQERAQLFDLSSGPLLRALLLRFDDQDHLLMLDVHHIVFDGWSAGVLGRELAMLYSAFADDQPSPLPPLPIQYTDFARWQQEHLRGEVLAQHLAYWHAALVDAPLVLDLPTDRPRLPIQSGQGAAVPLVLPADLTGALTTLSHRTGCTLFMTLCTAFAALLSRYSGQADLLIGLPIAQRLRLETEPLIGFFANTVIVRANLTGDPPFLEALETVREAALGAYAHQEAPFARVVEVLQPERDLGRNPLYQVAFTLQNLSAMPYGEDLAGLTLHPAPTPITTTTCDLTLTLRLDGDVLTGHLEYSTDLFDADTVARMAGHFATLLEGVVADPTRRISVLPLLSVDERHQLLVTWNHTRVDDLPVSCVHDLVAAQASRTPDAIALQDRGEMLTYRVLDMRANRLAVRLRALGVAPDVLVGLCMERSVDMVVGLLGILKAGGAYVPLDPAYPPARLAFMLQDAQAPVLLTQARLCSTLPPYDGTIVVVDDDGTASDPGPLPGPAVAATPDDLAYVIYTSGSTGTPKGVPIPHRALTNLLTALQRTLGLTSTDVLLAVTTLSFDIAALEIFLPLIVGARIVLASRAETQDGRLLADALARAQKITVMQATPSTWRLLLAAGWQGEPRLMALCGGESLSGDLARMLRPRVAALWNLYGPTETTIWSTAHPVEDVAGVVVPIGRPLANTDLYVLDDHGQPVPPNVEGELYIGGAGLARGYLRRPGLTAEKFVHHPFSDDPDARLFKSGDIARYRRDGALEILRRRDHQVKIRGQRIELGEVEVALLANPAVREAAVIVREDDPGDQRLVAYIVTEGASTPTPGELRALLRDRLPGYGIPSAFVFLDALPLSPSGKLDRTALPPPSGAGREGAPAHDVAVVVEAGHAVGDDVERRMIEIWERVLDVRPVRAADNFFDLGGHSLLAARLVEEIATAFGWRLPLGALFEDGTVGHLAALIRAQEQGMLRPTLVPLQPHGSRPPLFCTHPADGSIVYYRLLAQHLDPEQPVYGLQAEVRPFADAAPVRLEDLAAAHIRQMRAVQPAGPYYVSGYSAGGLLAFEIAQQLRAQGQEVALLVLFDTFVPRDAATPPDQPAPTQAWTATRTKLRYHWTVWSDLAAQDRVGYARARIAGLGRRLGTFPQHLRRGLPSDETAPVQGPRPAAWLPYRPETYPGRVTLFRGQLTLAHARGVADARLAWEQVAEGGLEVHEVPGDHFGVVFEPVLARHIAAELQKCLTAAQRR